MQSKVDRMLSSRQCSSSGRASADGSCVGSRSLSAALQRRKILYEPLLVPEPQTPIASSSQIQESASETALREGQLQGTSRRRLLQCGGSAALFTAAFSQPSEAVMMPQAMDNAWSAVGGGPADLTFPDAFLGSWLTECTLSKLETPLGLEYVPNPDNVDRAVREDLKKRIRYEVAYIKNKKGKVIIDRRFNIRSLINVYMGRGAVEDEAVSWNPDDPNRLQVQLPGGQTIVTRVVRRSEENPASDRINTSEFFEQVFQNPNMTEPKVKASQCFTKYKFRSQSEAAKLDGPQIVATQVISDYLTPYDGEGLMLKAKNRPVVIYTYNMSFKRTHREYTA